VAPLRGLHGRLLRPTNQRRARKICLGASQATKESNRTRAQRNACANRRKRSTLQSGTLTWPRLVAPAILMPSASHCLAMKL
jgi:hypothetical protein